MNLQYRARSWRSWNILRRTLSDTLKLRNAVTMMANARIADSCGVHRHANIGTKRPFLAPSWMRFWSVRYASTLPAIRSRCAMPLSSHNCPSLLSSLLSLGVLIKNKERKGVIVRHFIIPTENGNHHTRTVRIFSGRSKRDRETKTNVPDITVHAYPFFDIILDDSIHYCNYMLVVKKVHSSSTRQYFKTIPCI